MYTGLLSLHLLHLLPHASTDLSIQDGDLFVSNEKLEKRILGPWRLKQYYYFLNQKQILPKNCFNERIKAMAIHKLLLPYVFHHR